MGTVHFYQVWPLLSFPPPVAKCDTSQRHRLVYLHVNCDLMVTSHVLFTSDRLTNRQSDLCVNKALRVVRYLNVIQTKRQTYEKRGRLGTVAKQWSNSGQTVAKQIVGRKSMTIVGHLSNTTVVGIMLTIGRRTKRR